MNNESIIPYKLEQHLNEICSNNPIYANLLSVWNINKKMCQDVLSTVVINYPHYTKHDISHSEAIITNIEMLLGEDNIKCLSPTDTWLLLQAAYLHDIGMVIECKKIEDNWETKEFQNYLKDAENSNDPALAQNAKFINSFASESLGKENVTSWPVRVRYAVTILIAEYYRGYHAQESKSYIDDMGKIFNVDLGFNGLIQKRLVLLLADIVCLHTEQNSKILDLDYKTNGFNADYVHPRFVAQMLRIGDLLDADNNRFNSANEVVFGKIPESSKNHWEKHISTNHILITPDVIEYRADCDKIEVYRETKRFISWLKEEVEFWSLNWKNIMPRYINGSAPRLGACELLLNGVPDIEGLSDLRFSISPEKAFEVIEGSNIYEDQFVFLREVIQNALDACKVQLWRDITQEKYKSWITTEKYEDIQPYEIKQEIFNNYGVEVKIYDYDEENIKVVIKDNGIGISANQFIKMCDVGKSYLGDRKRKEEIDNMPLWLRPTSGFGIGLQSVFLVAEEFEILSKCTMDEGIYARVASRRKNGYVQVTKSEQLKTQGTEISVIISRNQKFSYGLGGNTFRYIEDNYDPFSKKDLVYYKIWDVVRYTMESTYFPIKIYYDDELKDIVESGCFIELKDCKTDMRYRCKELEDYGMELWDRQSCTLFRFRLGAIQNFYNNRYYFKGVEVKRDGSTMKDGISFEVDFYGLDTKKTLTLDRKKIRKKALEDVDKILDSALGVYLNEVETRIFEKEERTDEENKLIYIFWCLVSLKKKMELLDKYSKQFKNVLAPIDVMVKKADNVFERCEKDFKEVIKELRDMAIIQNRSSFVETTGNQENLNVELIKKVLDEREVQYPFVVIDKHFSEMMSSRIFSEIKIISHPDLKNKMCLVSFSTEEGKLPKVNDSATKMYFIQNMLKKDNSAFHYGFHSSSIRHYIIGIEGYEEICTTIVPFGIGGGWYPCNKFIISPITVVQWEKYNHLELEDYLETILSGKEFADLVDYVYLNQSENEKYTKENIVDKYRELLSEVYRIGKEKIEMK